MTDFDSIKAKYVVIQDIPDVSPEWCADLTQVYRFITGDICGPVKAIAKIIEPMIVDPADDRTFPTTKRPNTGVAAPGLPPTYGVGIAGNAGGAGGGGGSYSPTAMAYSSDNNRITNALAIIRDWKKRVLDSTTHNILDSIEAALTE